MAAFVVRGCIRCGIERIQLNMIGFSGNKDGRGYEVAVACQDCKRVSIFGYVSATAPSSVGDANLEAQNRTVTPQPVKTDIHEPQMSEHVPERIGDLFKEAAICRSIQRFEAAGAIFRKTIDVATKYLFQHDPRLQGRSPADALRSRIRALGEMKILEEDIVELADVVALDGNDAAHEMDPYSAEEAEALEELTSDLLDRLFVRPARVAAVKAKQIAAGQRSA